MPLQKKYFGFLLGQALSAFDTAGGTGIHTGVPVFCVYRRIRPPARRSRSSVEASEMRSPE
jgi:hypothetical protein